MRSFGLDQLFPFCEAEEVEEEDEEEEEEEVEDVGLFLVLDAYPPAPPPPPPLLPLGLELKRFDELVLELPENELTLLSGPGR